VSELLAFIDMEGQQILIVEDEMAIRIGLTDALVYHGYRVTAVADGETGLEKALTGTFDLVLLDVMLPGIDGFRICDEIRKVDRSQPIIMLTAKTTDDDIITGLTLGADDYVAKPFSVAELVLRIQAVLRRASGEPRETRVSLAGGAELDLVNLSGSLQGEAVAFTRREAEILEYLCRHAERPVSRDELLNKVWGYDRHAGIETRTVDIHIAKLRRKIEPDPKEPQALVTVRGAGYKLLVAVADLEAAP
jgi:DNA-binding response OmpR family regulator